MRFAALLLGLLFAIPAWPQNQPEVTSHEGAITFSSKVNLVSVPVVVRDSAGRTVGNLKQEDFQLFDKGKLQIITKFSMEQSESTVTRTSAAAGSKQPTQPQAKPIPGKPALPERYIAYLFDDVHLQRADLLQTRRAVNRHLDEALDPGSRAAIFTTSGRMMADFTDDIDKLHQAVNNVQPWTSGPDPQLDCPPISFYMADLLANRLLYFSGFLFTDEKLAGMVNGGQADQALSAALSEGATCGFGVDAAHLVDSIRQLRTAIHQVLEYGNRETTFSLGAVMDIIRRMSAMPGSRTIVLVSPGFLLTRDNRSAEYDVLDRALRANVAVNTIDMRGLYTMAGADASQRGAQSSAGGYLTQAEISAASQADDVLGELADGTGGTFFHNDNGLKEGLNLPPPRRSISMF